MTMMKIDRELRTNVEQKPIHKKTASKQNFEQIVRTKATHMKQQDLEKLLQDITEQGKKVARFRSFKDLARYKRLIQQFLEEAVFDGLSVKETRNFNPSNFSHKLITVEKIDEQLIQLTDDLLDQEKKTVDLLALIGEIEGLLVNLYM